jgi:hypothetical protein
MKARAQDCNGNHPGVVQYKGQWYLFYFNQDLPGGHDKRRAINVIPFEFNSDGSIPELPHSKTGIVKAVKNLNPFDRVEAETIAWEEGIETARDEKTGIYVTDISNGDYIKVRNVDFGKGTGKFEASVASASEGGAIEIHLDSPSGNLIGTCVVKSSGGMNSWMLQSCKIQKVSGVHDVFFVFRGEKENLFNYDWWKFSSLK